MSISWADVVAYADSVEKTATEAAKDLDLLASDAKNIAALGKPLRRLQQFVSASLSICTLLCFALLCFTLLCFALLCFALLCFALLYFTTCLVLSPCHNLLTIDFGRGRMAVPLKFGNSAEPLTRSRLRREQQRCADYGEPIANWPSRSCDSHAHIGIRLRNSWTSFAETTDDCLNILSRCTGWPWVFLHVEGAAYGDVARDRVFVSFRCT
eukprot:SAG31_NODE_1966_length_6786_cov_7.109167_2_plen_211_part_00